MPADNPPVLLRDQGPRADEAHLAAQDVDQLRQLVDRGPAQKAADARDPRVLADLEHDAVVGLVELGELGLARLRVGEHRTELEDRELVAVAAHASLTEEHRAARVELDRDRDGDQQRRQAQQPEA
jgi:hypothetical protein